MWVEGSPCDWIPSIDSTNEYSRIIHLSLSKRLGYSCKVLGWELIVLQSSVTIHFHGSTNEYPRFLFGDFNAWDICISNIQQFTRHGISQASICKQ